MTPVEGQTISGGKPPITLRSDQSGVSLTSAVPASVPMQHARLGSCHGAFLNHCRRASLVAFCCLEDDSRDLNHTEHRPADCSPLFSGPQVPSSSAET